MESRFKDRGIRTEGSRVKEKERKRCRGVEERTEKVRVVTTSIGIKKKRRLKIILLRLEPQ